MKKANPILEIFNADFSKIKRAQTSIFRIRKNLLALQEELCIEISNEILATDLLPEIREFLNLVCVDGETKKPLIEILIKRIPALRGDIPIGAYSLSMSKLLKICDKFEYGNYLLFMEKLANSFIEIKFNYYIKSNNKLYLKMDFK